MATLRHDPDYKPRGVVEWFEYRLPIFSFVNGVVGVYPTPRNLNYWWNFGSIAGVCLLVQIITGIVLAMHYTPQVTLAFDSVEHIMRDVNYGWLLRYAHAVGASMFFVVTYIHIMRGLYYGSYKSPREVLWWLGVIILLLMMATAFMGYVLPWGQMSFWGATVITNLFSAIPLVGPDIVTWLWGGFAVDNPTLNRFFSLHYLLPFVIVGVVVLHIWALHRFGSSNPLGVEVKRPEDTIPFHPYYTVKDTLGFAVFFLVFAWFVFFSPNSLGHPDNYTPANPMVTPPHIVPEWYFLPFYAILRAIPNKLGGVVAMFGSILVMFFLPWIDKSPVRSATYRPIYKIMFWAFLADCILLGYAGSQTPDWGQIIAYCTTDAECKASTAWTVIHIPKWLDFLPRIMVSGIATLYYFLHFVLLWAITKYRIETPLPVPESITHAVLKDYP